MHEQISQLSQMVTILSAKLRKNPRTNVICPDLQVIGTVSSNADVWEAKREVEKACIACVGGCQKTRNGGFTVRLVANDMLSADNQIANTN